MDRLAPMRRARLSGARQRPWPDAEIVGGEVSISQSRGTQQPNHNLHGSSDMSLCHSDSDQALAVLVRTFPNAPVASANLATLSACRFGYKEQIVFARG